ncbi:hypothetical protein V6N12_068123 [Hibiscus sabdariffa]|uniref:Uncharacterized protein n=1 Tax=Hibiscus sabdariffa TaxID=183260 RepID=A0ABR2FPS3_9ROSI
MASVRSKRHHICCRRHANAFLHRNLLSPAFRSCCRWSLNFYTSLPFRKLSFSQVNLPIANARLQSTPLPLVSPSEPRTRSLTSFLFLPSGRVTSSSPSCLPASSSYGHGPWFYQHLRFP